MAFDMLLKQSRVDAREDPERLEFVLKLALAGARDDARVLKELLRMAETCDKSVQKLQIEMDGSNTPELSLRTYRLLNNYALTFQSKLERVLKGIEGLEGMIGVYDT